MNILINLFLFAFGMLNYVNFFSFSGFYLVKHNSIYIQLWFITFSNILRFTILIKWLEWITFTSALDIKCAISNYLQQFMGNIHKKICANVLFILSEKWNQFTRNLTQWIIKWIEEISPIEYENLSDIF